MSKLTETSAGNIYIDGEPADPRKHNLSFVFQEPSAMPWRTVSQNVAYEIPMLLVVVSLVMVMGTLNLSEIVGTQSGGFWHWNVLRLTASPLMPFSCIIFFICMLAETNRAPFDMAEAKKIGHIRT